MLANVGFYFRKLKRAFSRSYWAIRLFGLTKSKIPEAEPGLIMVQIDGLSGRQFHRALKHGRLPFLRYLLRKENYKEYVHYSGIPSSTPAVQGELFYGVKGSVPAFQFVDAPSEEIFTMYNPVAVAAVERRLSKNHRALLEGGSSYSNIFRGGAEEAHFCSATLGWRDLFRTFRPGAWIAFFLFHLDIFFRLAALLVLETVLAVYDSIRGVLAGQKFWIELEFILTRVFFCIFLRELVVLGAKIDIARGLPIIHVNFLGYDEQAHRRGPSSEFAHWCLRGIDDSIARIWQEARNAAQRDYDLWVYSDHGQEETLSYPLEHQSSFQEVVAKLFKGEKIKVTGLGPLIHVHPSEPLREEKKEEIIQKLLNRAKVPLVLTVGNDGKVRAQTISASYKLPEDAVQLLGKEHPFLEEATRDLIRLCHHPSAGKIIVAGWYYGARPWTFPAENGSHAGFGPEETRAFALLPGDAPLPFREHEYLRPLDLREAALRLLGRSEAVFSEWQPMSVVRSFRIMTYNVHGCLGMDGKISPARIARVIARQNPDIVALQEIDVKRKRSGHIDQAEVIAKQLRMRYFFHPSFHMEDEKYGNAVLSRYSMRVIRSAALPSLRRRIRWEYRGALWVEIEIGEVKLHLINTHLGLWPQERKLQAETLVGPDWLGSEDCGEPVILCGDFNALPRSPVCRKLGCRLRDVQTILDSHRPHGTWFSACPIHRIDHIFVSPSLAPITITVPKTVLDRAASDHMPLIVELEINSKEGKKKEKEI